MNRIYTLLEDKGAIMSGHFILTSGLHSNMYIEKFRVLEDPESLDIICKEMADKFKNIDIVVSAAVGGILISSGVSVMEAMELVIKVVNNRVYEIAVKDATKSIENGISISESLKNTGVFPPIMIQLFSTGEETGEIDSLSLKASDFYTKQVNASVDRLTSLIEPLLIILVGIVIGGVIIVTYLPIFQVGAAIAN